MSSMNGLKILWVDDNEMIRLTGKEMLLVLNCVPETAESAEAALDMLKDGNYDILISDLGMPGMDGWELMDTIREDYPGMKRMVLSGWNDNTDAGKLKDLKIDRVLDKPITMDELKQALASLNS